MFDRFVLQSTTDVYHMAVCQIVFCISVVLCFYNKGFLKLSSKLCGFIQQKTCYNEYCSKKHVTVVNVYNTDSWLTLRKLMFRIALFLISAIFWICVIYYSLFDDTRAAVLSYFGVASTVFTVKYALREIKILTTVIEKTMISSSLLLIQAGFCLLILERFQTTAFYLLCLGVFVEKMRFEINRIIRANRSCLVLDEISREDTHGELESRGPTSEAKLEESNFVRSEPIYIHDNAAFKQNVIETDNNETEDFANETDQDGSLFDLYENGCYLPVDDTVSDNFWEWEHPEDLVTVCNLIEMNEEFEREEINTMSKPINDHLSSDVEFFLKTYSGLGTENDSGITRESTLAEESQDFNPLETDDIIEKYKNHCKMLYDSLPNVKTMSVKDLNLFFSESETKNRQTEKSVYILTDPAKSGNNSLETSNVVDCLVNRHHSKNEYFSTNKYVDSLSSTNQENELSYCTRQAAKQLDENAKECTRNRQWEEVTSLLNQFESTVTVKQSENSCNVDTLHENNADRIYDSKLCSFLANSILGTDDGDNSLIPEQSYSNESSEIKAKSLQSLPSTILCSCISDLGLNTCSNGHEINGFVTKASADVDGEVQHCSATSNIDGVVNKIDLSFIYNVAH